MARAIPDAESDPHPEPAAVSDDSSAEGEQVESESVASECPAIGDDVRAKLYAALSIMLPSLRDEIESVSENDRACVYASVPVTVAPVPLPTDNFWSSSSLTGDGYFKVIAPSVLFPLAPVFDEGPSVCRCDGT